jgi:hypothetical protein
MARRSGVFLPCAGGVNAAFKSSIVNSKTAGGRLLSQQATPERRCAGKVDKPKLTDGAQRWQMATFT